MKNDLSKYYEIRDQIGTFDRLEWHSNSLLGKMIRWKTKDWSNHTGVAIVFHEYTGAGVFSIESLEHGVDPNRLSLRLKEFNGEVRWYPLKKEFEDRRQYLGEIGLGLEGTKYDMFSLFRNLFNRVPIGNKKLFCSEFVTYTGLVAGLPYNKDYLDGKAPTPGRDMDGLGWWEKGIRIL